MKGNGKFIGRLFFTMALVILLAAPAFPQAPELAKVERKNKAPVSAEVLKVALPRPVKATLSNGARVLIVEDHRSPLIGVKISIEGAGGMFEPADLRGLAKMTASQIQQGTKTRTSKQITDQLALLGVQTTVRTDFGSTDMLVNALGLSENFDQWFAIVTDYMLNPTFPETELRKAVQNQLASLKLQRSDPDFLSEERMNAVLFGDHPAATVSSDAEALNRMTPALLAQWHRERFVPRNTVIAISGDVTPNVILAKLKQAFAGWKNADLKVTMPPNPKAATKTGVFLIDRPASVQTSVRIGNIALDRTDPDYFPFRVMNQVLGEGSASRIFINLREVHGYTYGAYSHFDADDYPGAWLASAEVRTAVTEEALGEFFNEIRRINNETVSAAELDKAKRCQVAGFALSMGDSPLIVLTYWLDVEAYKFPMDYWDTFASKIMRVTPADVQRVARKYINPDNLQVVVVGDGAKIKPALEKCGPVTVFDMVGKPVSKQ